LSPFDSQLRTLAGAPRRSHSCQKQPFCLSKTLSRLAGWGVQKGQIG